MGLAPRLFAADVKSPVVDTHLHCFAWKNDPRFPCHEDGPYQPAEPSTPEHLLGLMAAAGVDYAIVVHPEPYQDDHRYLEHCLTAGRGKLKGTCLFFAGRPHSADGMRTLVRRCPIAAVRVHAYNPERLPPFGDSKRAASPFSLESLLQHSKCPVGRRQSVRDGSPVGTGVCPRCERPCRDPGSACRRPKSLRHG